MSAREHRCYTDGSCKPGEGAPGGWGFVIEPPSGPPVEGWGSEVGTLAKVMEYRAVAEAVQALPDGARAVVFSDAQSLVENLARKLADWTASDFRNVDPLVVADVRRIAAAIADRGLSLRFQWVRGHAQNAGNARADALAAQGAREAKAAIASRGGPDAPRRRPRAASPRERR